MAFTNVLEAYGVFTETELDEGVDFTPTGDFGQIITVSSGFGDGGFGEGPFGGGTTTLIIDGPTTEWTNIDTP